MILQGEKEHNDCDGRSTGQSIRRQVLKMSPGSRSETHIIICPPLEILASDVDLENIAQIYGWDKPTEIEWSPILST